MRRYFEQSSCVEKRHPVVKTEARKNAFVAVWEPFSRAELEKKRARTSGKIRSKSARSILGLDFIKAELKKRFDALEPLWRAESLNNNGPEPERKRKQSVIETRTFEVKECRCRSKTFGSEGFEDDVKWYLFRPLRKCRSTPDVSKTTSQKCKKIFDSERDFFKVKRSLMLLGFELSDFGICSSGAETVRKWKREKPTTSSTRVTGRSGSLETLRLTVRRAWTDDRLDESHRRLLAQAAYDEWYFKKEQELRKKREQESVTRMKTKEIFENDYQKKKEKSKEEFKKWLFRKRMKRKMDKENLLQKQEQSRNTSKGRKQRLSKNIPRRKVGEKRLKKVKEESQKAFIKWKQVKERELQEKRREKLKEDEKRIEKETQKKQKKIIAEKVFQKWKSKLEENERLAKTKTKSQEKKQEKEERRRMEGSFISFQMWKIAKDEQMKEKIKQIREADKIAREERMAQMEERMYEAEQAFEDWLEKVDLRKQKKYSKTHVPNQKIIPWIPI